jgi:hypothetical protein
MQTVAYVLARFSEPSSYAGLGALLALAGFHFSDSVVGQIAQFLAAGCGLAALFLKERGLIQMIALAGDPRHGAWCVRYDGGHGPSRCPGRAHRDRAGDVCGARRGQSGERRRRRRR